MTTISSSNDGISAMSVWDLLKNPGTCAKTCCNAIPAVHKACYGVTESPKGTTSSTLGKGGLILWTCDRCNSSDDPNLVQCGLCPVQGGFFKHVCLKNGRWRRPLRHLGRSLFTGYLVILFALVNPTTFAKLKNCRL
ncbi:uncharacterized protein LOC110854375 [Folsomia candida]|uniref:Peregrin n=1 Tax=Folsomia candida TaxID=158441 RepID=A0A226DXK2_FOLCA|nr:uncharacterized protein LOC110854375 [Folsomia candida]OXA50205.1 Peregrin [Folsomia candida]